MPKFKKDKEQKKQQDLEQQKIQKALLKQSMFKSSYISYLLAAVMFIISFIFNGKFVTIPNSSNSTAITVLDVLLKAFAIILFFFFAFVAFGNYMELEGYIMDYKHIILLVAFALLQSSTELYVFLASLGGVVLILVYMYFIQAKVQTD
jgi:hypothetical protein